MSRTDTTGYWYELTFVSCARCGKHPVAWSPRKVSIRKAENLVFTCPCTPGAPRLGQYLLEMDVRTD